MDRIVKIARIFLLTLVTALLILSFGGYLVNQWAQEAVYNQQHWQHTSDIIWQDQIWQDRVQAKINHKILAGNKIEKSIEKSLPQKQKILAPYLANIAETELRKQLYGVFESRPIKIQWDRTTVEFHRQVVAQLRENPDYIDTNTHLDIDLRPFATALIVDTKAERFTQQINELPKSASTIHPLKTKKAGFAITLAGHLNRYHQLFAWGTMLSGAVLILLNRVWLIGLSTIAAGIIINIIQERVFEYTTTGLPDTASSRVIQIWWQDDRSQITDHNLIAWGIVITIIGIVLHLAARSFRSRKNHE